jgi:uncharacterized membrane protein YeiH
MLYTIEIGAVVASGLYGVLLGCRKGLDAVGVFTIAFAVAFGGGTLRDLLLDRQPLFWMANDHYLVVVFVLALIGSVWPRLVARCEKLLPIPDALGIALFSITGAAYAIEAGHSPIVASILAVITGTFGGVIAEIICNEIPSLFRSAPLQATCSFVGAWVYLVMELYLPVPHAAAVWTAFAVIALWRLAALRWNWQLPNAAKAVQE